MHQQLERGVVDLVGRHLQCVENKLFADHPLVEDELDVECGCEAALDFCQNFVGEPFDFQRRVIDGRRLPQRGVTDRVGFHLGDLGLPVTERAKRLRHRLVDDFEVSATGKLLELDQCKIWLDPRRVAIHHQADGAGRRHNGRLRIAEAVCLAKFDRAVPCTLCRGDKLFVMARCVIKRHRWHTQSFVARFLPVGRASVIADDAQHVAGVVVIAWERPELFRHFGARRIGNAGHDRRDRTADRAAFGRIVADAGRHQQPADVGKAEAERAIPIAQLGDFLGWELRHENGDFKNDGPQPASVLETGGVEDAVLGPEHHQVQRRQIAGSVIEEHVLRARVRRADRSRFRARMPVVDRGVELDARIG